MNYWQRKEMMMLTHPLIIYNFNMKFKDYRYKKMFDF